MPFQARKAPLVLVVDDDIQMVVMMRSNLETEGYRVEFATDGITGKQMAWDLKPDLIISDIYMPGIDGVAMLEAIKEHPDLKNTPVIFLSGKAMEKFVADDPAQRYALMKKPIFLPELNQLIRQFLSEG